MKNTEYHQSTRHINKKKKKKTLKSITIPNDPLESCNTSYIQSPPSYEVTTYLSLPSFCSHPTP